MVIPFSKNLSRFPFAISAIFSFSSSFSRCRNLRSHLNLNKFNGSILFFGGQTYKGSLHRLTRLRIHYSTRFYGDLATVVRASNKRGNGQLRCLTPNEAFRIQSFDPSTFDVRGLSRRQLMYLAGNAIDRRMLVALFASVIVIPH